MKYAGWMFHFPTPANCKALQTIIFRMKTGSRSNGLPVCQLAPNTGRAVRKFYVLPFPFIFRLKNHQGFTQGALRK